MSLPNFFGLDIGNTSIKIVQIKDQNSSKPKILKIGSIQTPTGAYGNSEDSAKKNIAEAIKELVDQLKLDTKKVVTGVSERDVFSARVKFIYENEKDIEESAYWAISKILPVPIDTVRHDYLPISITEHEGKKEMEALAVSVEKKKSDHYAEIIELANLTPLALETEGIALVRALSRTLGIVPNQGSLVIDIGSDSSSVCIVKGRNLVYSTSIPTGSDVITRSIAQAFSLDSVQAEEYKKTYGINEKYFEGKIANVIKPVIDALLIDINRALQFFKQDQPNASITSIKLLGESSAMPGLVPYITRYLGVAVEIADPLFGLDLSKSTIDNKQVYAVACGLALKNDLDK